MDDAFPKPGDIQIYQGKEYVTNEVGGIDIATKEPEVYCCCCGERVYAEFCDNGFGPYAVQIEPYHCERCEWIEGNDFQNLIGMKVIYISGSGKEWPAIITGVESKSDPIVRLIFTNERGKSVKKDNVCRESPLLKSKVWRFHEGKHAWKNGLFVDEN